MPSISTFSPSLGFPSRAVTEKRLPCRFNSFCLFSAFPKCRNFNLQPPLSQLVGSKSRTSILAQKNMKQNLQREVTDVPRGNLLLDQLKLLSESDPNLRLIGALAEASVREFQNTAKEAADVWLKIPPEELQDTLPPSQLADFDSRFVEVDGITIHYKETIGKKFETVYNKETGTDFLSNGKSTVSKLPTLVLLHGFAGSVFSWRLVMEKLANAFPGGCRVIAFDRPPFGLTSRPLGVEEKNNPYSNEGAGRLTLSLIEALGVETAILVGHSAGAAVAVEAALREGGRERVGGLVLVSPAVAVTGEAIRRADLATQLRVLYIRAVLQVPGAGLNYVRNQYIRRREEVLRGESFGYFDKSIITPEVVEGYVRPMKAKDWDKGALELYRNLSFNPIGDRINGLKVPVSIIQGREDFTVSEEAANEVRKQMEKVTSVDYHVIDKCGHLPQEEHPEDFTRLASLFLQKVFATNI